MNDESVTRCSVCFWPKAAVGLVIDSTAGIDPKQPVVGRQELQIKGSDMRGKLAVGSVLAFIAVMASAQEQIDQTKEINRLLDGCRVAMSSDTLTTVHQTNYKIGYCAGYLHASYTQHRVWDQLSSKEGNPLCLPDSFQLPDFARVVVEYADSHPDHVKETLFALIYRAYLQGYPCAESSE